MSFFILPHLRSAQDEVLDSGEDLSVAPRLIGQCGVPSNATVVEYDFYQRLVAVGTRDGRLKIVGADGVEALFISPRGTCTRQVGLTAQGGVLRLSDTGSLELWSLPEEIILSFVDEEEIECFELVHTTPFVVVGSKDGSLRVAQVVLGAGDNPEDFKLLPYRIDCETLAGSGSIVRIALQPGASTNKVLVGFSEGDVSLWALHEKKLVMTGSSELDVNGAKLSDVQWLGNEGERFVSGYDDGSLWLWRVPHEALPQFAPPAKPGNVTPLCRLDYATSSSPFASILSLRCGQAGTDATEGRCHLIAHGVSQDGMKAVMSVELEEAKMDSIRGGSTASQIECKAESCKTLPWFGNVESFCIIESISSNLELEIGAIVTLAEFCTIHIYDVESYMPFQVDTPFQRCTAVQSAALERGEAGSKSRMLRRLLDEPEDAFQPPILASGSPWPITGGTPTERNVDMPAEWGILVTGHQDGVARVWDAGLGSLKLLASFPSEDAPSSPIVCVSTSSNLLVIGYDSGEVRAFVSADQEEVAYEQLAIAESLEIENATHDGSPFACVIRSLTHQRAVSALDCGVDLGLIACGDEGGTVSAIDLEGTMLFCGQIFDCPVASVLLTTRDFAGAGGAHRCVVVSSEACSVALIDLDDPKTMPEVMTPKNASRLLCACVLDQRSHLVEASRSECELQFPGLAPRRRGQDGDVDSLEVSSSEEEEAEEAEAEGDGNEGKQEVCREEGGVNDDAGESKVGSRGFHVLQCSSGYLRIYPLTGIARGERSTWKKHKAEVPFVAAGAVDRPGRGGEASCAVTIDEVGTLGIWSIPGFESYWNRKVSDVIGWRWAPSEDARVVVSGDGQVAIILSEEVIRISLPSDDRRNPLPSLCLHDKEVADALEAALAAIAISSKDEEDAAARDKPKTKFGSFLSSAASMVTGQSAPQPASRPSVQQLHTTFSKAVVARQAIRPVAKSDPTGARAALGLGEGNSQRTPWFSTGGGGGASSSSSGAQRKPQKPGRRTVDEIKAAYGRDTTKVKSVMAENMNKLAERGEKLSQIQDKTQQLEDDAMDFMTMAKKLAEREKNKKWYEF